MAKRLRAAACVTLQAYGFDPRRALHDVFVESHYARTALVEGKPVAMWGLKGQLLSEVAYVWLVLSEEIGVLPLQIVREARKEMAEIMANYSEVATTVLPNDEQAVAFALCLGFHDRHDEEDPLPLKHRVRQVLDNPRHRIPIGESYVIGLGYHGGHA